MATLRECGKQSENGGAGYARRAGGCGHVHVSWQAHLPAHRCSRRSEPPPKPSCEAGTVRCRAHALMGPLSAETSLSGKERQRGPDLRAHVLRTACASRQGVLSSQRTPRIYARVALPTHVRFDQRAHFPDLLYRSSMGSRSVAVGCQLWDLADGIGIATDGCLAFFSITRQISSAVRKFASRAHDRSAPRTTGRWGKQLVG